MLEDPPCLVTALRRGPRRWSAAELREPAALAEVAALLRRLHGCGERVDATFSAPSASSRPTPQRPAGAAARSRPPTSAPTRTAARIEAALGAGAGDAAARSSATTTCSPPTSSARRTASGSSTGSTRGWATATSTSATSPSTTSSATREEEAFLAAYLGAAGRRARELAALRLMRFMSDFREAMWGVLQGSLSDLDFDFAGYAAKHFDRLAAAEAAPGFERPDRGRAWRRELSCRTRARCVIVGGGVGGTSLAYHLAELGWDDVVLLERSQLTSGSTFHSAGLVGQLRGSVSLTKMMMHSVDALPAARGGVRVRPRLGRMRRHPARLERGADGGAAPPGRLGEDLRAAAGADLRRGGAGAVPADVDRGRARRRLAADRRLPRSLAADLRARRRRPPRRLPDLHLRPG